MPGACGYFSLADRYEASSLIRMKSDRKNGRREDPCRARGAWRQRCALIEPARLRFPAIDAPKFRGKWKTFWRKPKPWNRVEREPSLPDQELVEQGLADLEMGQVTDYSLLLLIAAPRLKRQGIEIPNLAIPWLYEHQLFARLTECLGAAAYSYYNSLIRRVVSYARALEPEQGRN
jgi:hypothetical protein